MDHFDFDLVDMKLVFPNFERFTEPLFHDIEYGFNLVSLIILLLVND